MHSSWFPRPIYKQVRWISLLFIVCCVFLGFSQGVFWILGLVYLLAWMVMLVLVAANIHSGHFIQSINSLATEHNTVFLTFDDGPVEQTEKILDLLKKHEAKASFFCIGKQVKKFPQIVKRIVSEGHAIGNHSYNHKSTFPISGVARIKGELVKTEEEIKKISGAIVYLFRPPFGVTNPLIARAIQGLKLQTIGWTVRSFDTQIKTKEEAFERIRKKIKPGSIILLHDTVEYCIELLEEVLIMCKEKNLKSRALHEIIKPDDYE